MKYKQCMSDIDPHDSSELDLIDFSSPSSDSSSGELFEPSVEFDSNDSRKDELEESKHTLERVNKSLDYVDQKIVETSPFLSTKSRRTRGTEIKMFKVYETK